MKKITALLGIIVLTLLMSACGIMGAFSTRQEPSESPPPGQTETSTPSAPQGESAAPYAPSSYTNSTPMETADPVTELGGFDVITDLSGLNLIDHDLTGSDMLEHTELTTFLRGVEFATVTIISYAETAEWNGVIFNDAWAIELYYFARRHESALEAVVWSANYDLDSGYFFSDSYLEIGSVRTSADHQTAYMVIVEEMRNGNVRICFYLAQNVPDTNEVVLLDIVLFLNLWDRHDDVVLAELSQHIGINLSTYMIDFFAGSFAGV